MTITRGAPLTEIGPGLYALLPGRRGWGLANCGLLVGRDSALWIDSPYDRRLAERFLAASRERLSPGADVDRVVVTHTNGDHLWGACVLPDAEVVATEEARTHLCLEPTPDQLRSLAGAVNPATPWGAYVVRHFGAFDWSATEVPPVTTTFTGALELTVGGFPVRLASLPPGHTAGDLFVHLPEQGVVFTGDAVFGSTAATPGDHPSHWAGPLSNLIDSCERFLATGARTFVPGHGPVLDAAGIKEHIGYLEYVAERAHAFHAAGVPAAEAARRVIAERNYPELGLPERLVITIGSEYRVLDGDGHPEMLPIMRQVAQLAWDLAGDGAAPGG
ncbi:MULTISPECIES: MBL fold metallo-hydrolase [Streptomyces]|uniref:MBL fold metallo-hydrolase n=1 Tax=Streptomyces TaxID=1883 RepID=UPI00140CE6C4|nr:MULTISPECIES: MBL fold metallo-hydrolase [Streptomyces]MDH6224413.1 cyclase [Streptomyces sp. MJP52]